MQTKKYFQKDFVINVILPYVIDFIVLLIAIILIFFTDIFGKPPSISSLIPILILYLIVCIVNRVITLIVKKYKQ